METRNSSDGYDATSHKARKDKRRWCKGKVGREHDYQISVPENTYLKDCHVEVYHFWYGEPYERWRCRHQMICTKCGKQLMDDVKCPLNTTNMKQGWL